MSELMSLENDRGVGDLLCYNLAFCMCSLGGLGNLACVNDIFLIMETLVSAWRGDEG